MTPDQRRRLGALEGRFTLDGGKQLIATMKRIDDRPPLAQSFTAARRARVRELLGACALIALGLATLFFL